MKIVHNNLGEYADVINSYYDVHRFDDNSSEEVLFVGYNTSTDELLKSRYANYKRKVYINLEAPCSFLSYTPNTIESQSFFNEVYTICPYTADWLNKSENTATRYIPIPFPFRKGCYGNINHPKQYDAIYMGHVFGEEHHQIIDLIRKYTYCFCSIGQIHNPYITHRNISSQLKWELLCKSKVSIALNLLHPNGSHISELKKYNGWENNKCFSQNPIKHIPQFKPRIIEAACCKTLNLVMKDDWNVIEKWFEPGKEFIYWSTISELRDIIDDVRINFKNYESIINNAYIKVMNYDIDALMEKIINKRL